MYKKYIIKIPGGETIIFHLYIKIKINSQGKSFGNEIFHILAKHMTL